MNTLHQTRIDFLFCSVVRRFEQIVEKMPMKTAVICGNESLGYQEFNEKINRVANALIQSGIEKESVIAIRMDRSPAAYIAQWAVLKAGAAFVFVSPSYPEERARFILEDSKAKYVLVDTKACLAEGEFCGCKALVITDLMECENYQNPNIVIEKHDLCYCIYTSGSTGKPKGVMIEHGNLANFVDANEKNREILGITERASVVISIAALTFDVSIMEEFVPLTNGLCVVLATQEEIQDPVLLSACMEKNGVDCIIGTPSYFAMLLEIPQAAKALSGIVTYDIGAEAFQPGLYKKLMAVSRNAVVMNGYGPTETTISCTMKIVEDDENITIGFPSANVFVYVINEKNEEVPDGEIGELLICGDGVGRGYIGLPEKTAESFIEFRGQRAYKTGDLVRINGEGEIEFHGRNDHQVKLRGLRIELGEIEEVLCSCENITSAAVTVYDNSVLCAYYTARKPIDPDTLRDYAAQKLAYYMVPDLWMQLEEMPLTANMKVDRKALPKPVITSGDNGGVPVNAVQKRIYDIVSGITGNDSFGIRTPFMSVGLTSLKAMQLNVCLSDAFGITVKTSDLFEYDTVEKLEQFLNHAGENSSVRHLEVYPLTGSQQGIFAECLKHPGSTIYNIPFLFKLDSNLDVNQLRDAVQKVLEAHPYLNTNFMVLEDGSLGQKPGECTYEIPIVKMSDSEFEKMRSNLAQPFELQNSRMFRIAIYQTDCANYLFTDFHHIVADGNSYDIFFEDLNKAYIGENLRQEQYTGFDVALEEEADRRQGRYQRAARYYDRLLSGLEVESLPKPDCKEDCPKKGFMSRILSFSPEKAELLCRENGVTPNTLFTGVFGVVAARFSNDRDALFATIYNGRNDSRLTNTMCMLVKTLPVHTHFDENTRLSAYLSELQEQLMQSMACDVYPFAEIAAKYEISSDLIFAYQAELTDDYAIGDGMARGEDLSLDLPKEPIALQVRLRDGRYVLESEYRADLYSVELMDCLLSSYDAALQSASQVSRVSEISILSKEQEALLDQWNQTEQNYDSTQTRFLSWNGMLRNTRIELHVSFWTGLIPTDKWMIMPIALQRI